MRAGGYTVSGEGLVTMALLNLKGVGTRTALKILDEVHSSIAQGDAQTLFYDFAARFNSSDEVAGFWEKACRQVDDCEKADVKPICFADEEFPTRLRSIPDPPAMIYVKGPVSALHLDSSVAIVGALDPTDFGVRTAWHRGREAAEAGVSVVSGLARGCDTAAHWGCLDANGTGVAVLAHGLDMVYPAENRALADELLLEGGCLVSEYPVGVKPFPKAFALRDRIQSGLSDGVLVVETPIRDGTMHTVNFARKQGRLVGCVQHPQDFYGDPRIQGNLQTIKKGASQVPDRQAFRAFLQNLGNPFLHHEPIQGRWDLEALQ